MSRPSGPGDIIRTTTTTTTPTTPTPYPTPTTTTNNHDDNNDDNTMIPRESRRELQVATPWLDGKHAARFSPRGRRAYYYYYYYYD